MKWLNEWIEMNIMIQMRKTIESCILEMLNNNFVFDQKSVLLKIKFSLMNWAHGFILWAMMMMWWSSTKLQLIQVN